MSKELLLYTGISNWSAEALINAMEDSKGDITLRVNSPGGDVFAGWGIIAKMQELEDAGRKVKIKVDGGAFSMAAFMLLFASDVRALDTSVIWFHRAAMTVRNEEDQKFLDQTNGNLKTKMLGKINANTFSRITGYTIDQMFDPTQRIEIKLSASQAKELGIISDIYDLSPAEIAAFNNFNIAAMSSVTPPAPQPKQSKKMTLDELKAQHPDVFAAAVKAGTEAEQNRVAAWMVFADTDAEAVQKGIESGKEISALEIAKFSKAAAIKAAAPATEPEQTEEEKAKAKAELDKLKSQPAAPVTTPAATSEKPEAEKAVDDFLAESRKNLGIKAKV